MPASVPSELKLEEPEYEEDIGDLSPYLPELTSTSSRASSATISSFAAKSPRIDGDGKAGTSRGTEEHKHFAYGFTAPSTSSPSISTFANTPGATRMSRSTKTLPRTFQIDKEKLALRPLHNAINALSVTDLSIPKLQRWILGIAVVDFDLDHGPIIEGIYPPLSLLPSESENIAFASFPDSMQFDQGSQTFSFRVREQMSSFTETRRPKSPDGFIYGFSHFLQKRDSSSKRGYQQRSVVILTHHPYPAFFSSVASTFGPLFNKHGITMLEAGCHNIATWPDPVPGETLELGLLGSVFHVEFPATLDTLQLTETSSFNERYDPRLHILATAAPFLPPPLLLFEAALSNLWSIWECLVLCEPILIFGASPAQTSQAIWWLRDLLRPIPLAGDIRPFFTMQDNDHAQLVNRLPPKAGLILGVTNPFFEKSCAHWPHVLSLGRSASNTPKPKGPSLGPTAGPSPGWRTKTHKRYISKDRTLLKQLEEACLRGDDQSRMEASVSLRRHFCSRSTQLITPLARYLNSLIPSPNEVRLAQKATAQQTKGMYTSPQLEARSLSQGGLRLKPFNNAQFFSSLKANGSTLPFKSAGKKVEFYERWLKSPAFGTWLAQQEQIVQDVLHESIVAPSPLAHSVSTASSASSTNSTSQNDSLPYPSAKQLPTLPGSWRSPGG